MSRQLAAALAIASAAVAPSTVAAAASWRAPVPGRVVRPFVYSPRAPFARGARRDVELAALSGEQVLAPCSGPVAFRGRVPRFGPALSIRCGRLVATLLGVRATRAGFARRGARIGRATGDVRLGARRFGTRWGYRDPLSLIGTALGRPPAPVLPAPRPGAPRARTPGAASPPLRLPRSVWAGIGLLGSLLGPWAVSTSRRRSSTSTLRRTSAMRTR